jgi:hypothetical protein
MQRRSLVGGIGAIAFGVLPIVAFMVANPPGGNYKASDIADFIAKGHRPAVFVSVYLVLLSGAGLLLVLARFRESIADGPRATLFWGFSISAVAAWIVGYAIGTAPSPHSRSAAASSIASPLPSHTRSRKRVGRRCSAQALCCSAARC